MKEPRRIDYLPIHEVLPAKRNVKDHDLGALMASIRRFGFNDAIVMDDRTGRIVSGHGRVEALQALAKEGAPPPAGVRVGAGGAWVVPVQRGWASKDDVEAEAFLVAANRLVELGGWDMPGLAAVLADLAKAEGLEGTGYDGSDVDALLAEMAAGERGASADYTSRVKGPVYRPTGACPPVKELFDATKLEAMLAEIDAAEGITEAERRFLRLAAHRHVVFDYQNIAEFYAHAGPAAQALMEKSALVIIDFDKAIEFGFARLTQDLAEAYEDGAA